MADLPISDPPKPGEVYERDGRMRVVVSVTGHIGNYDVRYHWIGSNGVPMGNYRASWRRWVSKAKRVK